MEPIFEEPTPAPVRARIGRRGAIVAGVFGSLLLGGIVAASSIGGADTVLAASSTASPNPTASTAPTTGGSGGNCAPGGALGPDHEAVSDTSVAATAIGISEADLRSALSSGQTMAQVAKAHNVDVQKVIDALVADANTEIATALKNGTITQAQADAEKAQVTQRVTDQVNRTFRGGPGGRGDGDHGPGAPGTGPSTNGSSPAATPAA